MFQRRSIDVLISKNGGSMATEPKLEAARALGVPVLILKRPALPEVDRAFESQADTRQQHSPCNNKFRKHARARSHKRPRQSYKPFDFSFTPQVALGRPAALNLVSSPWKALPIWKRNGRFGWSLASR
ncbi:hypothetical protein DBADOPDK_05765 [Pseudomonas sp. MM223]|nr:hypothetical protein DBADOPDK_05765 [Pseudomonas sp. MM223]